MASAWGGSWGSAWGNAWGSIAAAVQSFAAEIDITPRRWYVRRGKKLHVFNDAQEADAFLEAEEQARQAIAKAKKASRKRRQRVVEVAAPKVAEQTIDFDELAAWVATLGMRVDLPALIAQEDFDEVMRVVALAQEQQEEDDIEMLLLAA